MFVDGYRDPVFFIEQSGFASPRSSLPIVFAFFLRYPRRQSLAEIYGQRINEGFIHGAQLEELPIRFFTVVKLHALRSERVANHAQIGAAEAIGGRGARRGAKHLRQIHDGVTRNCKSKLSLTLAGAFDTGFYQSASVQDGG